MSVSEHRFMLGKKLSHFSRIAQEGLYWLIVALPASGLGFVALFFSILQLSGLFLAMDFHFNDPSGH